MSEKPITELDDKTTKPFERDKKQNPYLQMIKERLESFALSEEDFLSLIESKKGTFIDQFKRTKSLQTPFKKMLVFKVCSILDLEKKHFLIDSDDERQLALKNGVPTKEEIFIKRYCRIGITDEIDEMAAVKYFLYKDYLKVPDSIRNPNIEVNKIPFVHHHKEEGDLIDSYESISQEYLKARKSIVCHELLLKGNNGNPGKYRTYRKAQNQLFNAIHISLSRGVSYERVFYLSPSESIHEKNINNEADLFKIMMIESSFETLNHIKTCIDKYQNDSKFYVSPFSGFRAHTKIDDRLLLTEDYKKDADYIKPYLIFTDNIEANSDIQELSNCFDDELKNRNSKKIYELLPTSFPLYLKSAKFYLEELIEKREKFIRLLGVIQTYKRNNNSIIIQDFYEKEFNEIFLFMIGNVKKVLDILKNQLIDVSTKVDKLT